MRPEDAEDEWRLRQRVKKLKNKKVQAVQKSGLSPDVSLEMTA